jgi:ubiquinone/menaquinone biosynthesis C-methylase UbiE
LTHIDGTPIKAEIEAGFVSADGRFLYPVIENVITILDYLAIPLTKLDDGEVSHISLRAEKKILQDFYDQVGWHKSGKDDANVFVDALKWEDLRPVVSEYIHNCHLRVNRYIKKQGQYLLDAGSGPVQYQDYLTYSEEYQFRICLDISYLALKEAKRKLGDKGICILGDITNIPLKDNSVDGAVSLHVIYHVPKDEQLMAIREIHRVLKPEASAAIIYSWPNSQLMLRFLWYRRVNKSIRKFIQKIKAFVKSILRIEKRQSNAQQSSVPETPYHYTHNQSYFETQLTGMGLQILVWRSVSVAFMRAYIHPWLFGTSFMRWIYRREEKNPQKYGRIGQYPLFVIKKLSS